jgi:hypothetical protein
MGNLALTGLASPAVYQSCFQRVYLSSTAPRGAEGLGNRTIALAIGRGVGEVAVSYPPVILDWLAPDPQECADLMAPTLTVATSAPETGIVYSATCAASSGTCSQGGYYSPVGSFVVSTPSHTPQLDFVQAAFAFFAGSGGANSNADQPAVFALDQDRLWVSEECIHREGATQWELQSQRGMREGCGVKPVIFL